MNWRKRRQAGRKQARRTRGSRPSRRPRVEPLESRDLLTAIVWDVDGDDFFDLSPANDPLAARRVIDAAVNYWNRVIPSFNYRNIGEDGFAPSDQFTFEIRADDLPEGSLAHVIRDSIEIDEDGKPYAAIIEIDLDADGSSWYFDPNPNNDLEFDALFNPFFARSNSVVGTDLFSTMVHEMAHGFGISLAEGLAIRDGLGPLVGDSGVAYYTFDDGTTALMSYRTSGGLHTNDTLHPDDLMNASAGPRERALISTLDARILADAYGYSVDFSVIGERSYVTTFDAAGRRLIVHGDLDPFNKWDEIHIDRDAQWLYVTVNGLRKSVWDGAIDNIYVNTGFGGDEVLVENTRAGQGLFIDTGIGVSDDQITLSYSARNLNTIQGEVTIKDYGTSTLILDDRYNYQSRVFTVESEQVSFTGSSALVKFPQNDTLIPPQRLKNLVIYGGPWGNSFVVNDDHGVVNTRLVLGARSDRAEVWRTFAPLTIEGGGGLDAVVIGNNSVGMSHIRATPTISNATGTIDLTLDDYYSTTAKQDVRVRSNEVTGMSPVKIVFDPNDIKTLTLKGSYAANGWNGFTVEDTPAQESLLLRRLNQTTIQTGPGDDVVQVWKTTAALVIDGGKGFDSVRLGQNGSMQAIAARVTIKDARHDTALILNDALNSGARAVRLRVSNDGTTTVDGLAPGQVVFNENEITSFDILGGLGNDTYTIEDTPRNAENSLVTVINTGEGSDQALVRGTSGEVFVNLYHSPAGNIVPDRATIGSLTGSLDTIQGKITILGDGQQTVSIYDNGNTSQQSVQFDVQGVRRANAADINIAGANFAEYFGSTGGSLFAIDGNAASFFELIGGAGPDLFRVGSPTAMIEAGRGYRFTGGSGSDTLLLNDSAVTSGQAYNFISNRVVGLGDYNYLQRAGVRIDYATIESLVLDCGKFDDTLSIAGAPNSATIAVNGHYGNDQVTVYPTLRVAGAIHFDGGDGLDSVTYDDSVSTTGRSYTLATGAMAATAGARISYLGVEQAALKTSAGPDTIVVVGTSSSTTTTVLAGAGADKVVVGDPLDGLQGALSISGGGDADSILFSDRVNTRPEVYDLYADRLERLGPADANGNRSFDMAPVQFTLFETVALNTNSGGNSTYVVGTALGTQTVVTGAAGATDVFWVNPDLAPLLGPVYFVGQAADEDRGTYEDPRSPGGQSYTVFNNPVDPTVKSIARTGSPLVTFAGLDTFGLVTPQSGGSMVNVLSIPAGTQFGVAANNGDAIALGASTGNGTRTLKDVLGSVVVSGINRPTDIIALVIDDSGNPSTTPRTVKVSPTETSESAGSNDLVGMGPARVVWRLNPASSVRILGSMADETFQIGQGNFQGRVSVDGGGGVNALSYTSWSQDVAASLAANVASGLAGGIRNFRHLFGGAGNDQLIGNDFDNIILGGAGNDTIQGRLGRDLLVGGSGMDTIAANDGADDIVIGGKLKYNDELTKQVDRAAVDAILSQWTSNLVRTERINRLRGLSPIGPNGELFGYPLNEASVSDDGVTDALFFDSTFDWLVAS